MAWADHQITDMHQRERNEQSRKAMGRLGDLAEGVIGAEVERRFEAPLLAGEPETDIWYRIPISNGMSGDGSEYHIYIKKGRCANTCVFLSGGGVAWNAYTAARPVTGGKVAAGLPNFYWNNLRPFTQIMNINTGITEIGNSHNPFNDWNFIVITYATGDFHVGNNEFHYTAEDGTEQVLYFHGYANFLEAMRKGVSFFSSPEKLLIAGDSAGAFAVPAVTTTILEEFYPACMDVTVLSDSGQLLYKNWKRTAKEVWKTDTQLWESIRSDNITVDWYRRLYGIWGDRIRYLYAGSPRDYLLSAYLNDVQTHQYGTNAEVQEEYYHQMQRMLRSLKEMTPKFGMFIYDFRNLRWFLGGTVHTAIRHKRFYFQTGSGKTMAQWLGDAVHGYVYDCNMVLMKGRE
ncbi:MAG: pectin acetylesterase-family hydrolase [Bilifractor sp.]